MPNSDYFSYSQTRSRSRLILKHDSVIVLSGHFFKLRTGEKPRSSWNIRILGYLRRAWRSREKCNTVTVMMSRPASNEVAISSSSKSWNTCGLTCQLLSDQTHLNVNSGFQLWAKWFWCTASRKELINSMIRVLLPMYLLLEVAI